jgi:hypothetical protein
MIVERLVKAKDSGRFTYPDFERYVGADGQLNAYGTVVCEKINTDYPTIVLETLPVICMHGGSAWLCGSCAQRLLLVGRNTPHEAGKPTEAKEQTPNPSATPL